MVNWDTLLEWEDNNNARVIWAVDIDLVRQRMSELNKNFSVSDDLILEFVTHTRRGWDMELFKQAFLDFVITKLEEEQNSY